jgi:hypothetical protein
MTPSQVLDMVRNQLNESQADFYGEQELYDYMWNAEQLAAQKTGCSLTTTTDTTVVAQREYTRPSNCLRIERLTWYNTKMKKITLTDVDAVEQTGYGHQGLSGQPVYYYEFGNTIGFSPIPSEAQTIVYYYVQEPTRLTAASSNFTIPDEYGHYLADYVLYRAYLKDQLMQEADRYYKI